MKLLLLLLGACAIVGERYLPRHHHWYRRSLPSCSVPRREGVYQHTAHSRGRPYGLRASCGEVESSAISGEGASVCWQHVGRWERSKGDLMFYMSLLLFREFTTFLVSELDDESPANVDAAVSWVHLEQYLFQPTAMSLEWAYFIICIMHLRLQLVFSSSLILAHRSVSILNAFTVVSFLIVGTQP